MAEYYDTIEDIFQMVADQHRHPRGTKAGNAFRRYRDDLLIAVTDVHILANSLYSKGLISREQLEYAQLLALTPSERKVHLFDAIEARLRSIPDDFDTLTEVLNGDPNLQIIAAKIHCDILCTMDVVVIDLPGRLEGGKLKLSYSWPYVTVERDESDVDEPMKNKECNESDESVEKKSIYQEFVRRGIRKLYGAARDMTAGFIKSALSILKLDIKIFRKYKKRFDKHTDHEQTRWWFEIWGDESALKSLESKWEEVLAKNKWRLETCHPVPPQRS